MRNSKKFVVACAAIGVVAVLSATAIATGKIIATEPERPEVDSVKALAVFSSGTPVTRQSAGEIQSLSSRSPANLLASKIDVSSARQIPVAGSANQAFVAATSDGGICALTTGQTGGLDSSCGTLEDFNSSGNLSVGMGPDGNLVAVSVQPDGVSTFIDSASTKGSRSLGSGAVATKLNPGETIRAGDVSISADAVLQQINAGIAAAKSK